MTAVVSSNQELQQLVEEGARQLRSSGLSVAGRVILYAHRALLPADSVDESLLHVIVAHFLNRGYITELGVLQGTERMVLEIRRPYAEEPMIMPIVDPPVELDPELLAKIPAVKEMQLIEERNRAAEDALQLERLAEPQSPQVWRYVEVVDDEAANKPDSYTASISAGWGIFGVKRYLNQLAFRCNVDIQFLISRNLVGRTVEFRVNGKAKDVAAFKNEVSRID